MKVGNRGCDHVSQLGPHPGRCIPHACSLWPPPQSSPQQRTLLQLALLSNAWLLGIIHTPLRHRGMSMRWTPRPRAAVLAAGLGLVTQLCRPASGGGHGCRHGGAGVRPPACWGVCTQQRLWTCPHVAGPGAGVRALVLATRSSVKLAQPDPCLATKNRGCYRARALYCPRAQPPRQGPHSGEGRCSWK